MPDDCCHGGLPITACKTLPDGWTATITVDGSLVTGFNGPPEDAPAGTVPIVCVNPDDLAADGTIPADTPVFIHHPRKGRSDDSDHA